MNLYDVLAGQCTTHFERLFSQRFAGGGKTQTLTGVPPLSFKANGKPLVSWSMLGNGQQTGTPTPDNPVMPQFVGVETANLYDNNLPYIVRCYYREVRNDFVSNSNNAFVIVPVEAGKRYYVSGAKRYSTSAPIRYCTSFSEPANGVSVVRTGTFAQSSELTIDINSGEKYLAIFLCGDSDYSTYGSVPNAIAANGETLVVDNGYKIPITCAGQTTPVYLGEVQTVRRIKKLVLDGTETVTSIHLSQSLYNIPVTDYKRDQSLTVLLCTHYISLKPVNEWGAVSDMHTAFYAGSVPDNFLYIRDSRFTTVADFKSYLAAQYAAGHPVTVWYVLAEPETGIVNEPLMRIGDHADELHSEDAAVTIPTANGQNVLTVDTELQPSSMTITFK